MATNPWPNERVVVVSDDPPAVEAAVVQLEQWGAQPAVMFERARAIRALSVQEPDLVVLDFGRDTAAARAVLVGLEELQPVLPGAAHPAPVVALAEGPIAPRLERDAWAPLHVVPHDDPAAVRQALLAALDDALGPILAVEETSAAAGTSAAAVSEGGAASAWGRLLPVMTLATALGIAGVAAALALGPRAAPDPQAAMPTTASGSQASMAPTGAPTAAVTVQPTAFGPTAPGTAAASVSTAPPAAAEATSAVVAPAPLATTVVPTLPATTVPTAPPFAPPTVVPATPAPTTAPASAGNTPAPISAAGAAAEVAAVTTPARLPVTGGR